MRLVHANDNLFLLDASIQKIRMDFVERDDPNYKLKKLTYPGIVLFYDEEDLPGVWAFGKEMESRNTLPSVYIERKNGDIYVLVIFELVTDNVDFLRGGLGTAFYKELKRAIRAPSILRIATAARIDSISYERFMRALEVKKSFIVQIAIQRGDDPGLYTECWSSMPIHTLTRSLPPPLQ